MEVAFYNDDGSYQTVVVEKNLRASDLCQILALKNRVGLDINWTVVEHWVDVGLGELLFLYSSFKNLVTILLTVCFHTVQWTNCQFKLCYFQHRRTHLVKKATNYCLDAR